MEIKKEVAVLNARDESAFESLKRFCKKERARLNVAEARISARLNNTVDNRERRKLEDSLFEIRVKRDELEENFKFSSLSKRMSKKTDEKSNSGMVVETRLLTPASTTRTVITEPVTNSKTIAKVTGYAAKFNSDSEDLGFTERILPGAFSDALRVSDVRALINHNPSEIFARSKKNLRLYEDGIGLLFFADLFEDEPLTNTIISRVGRGLWTQMSFSFIVDESGDTWQFRPGQNDLRLISKFKELFDIAIVTYPAYRDTTVSLLYEQKSRSIDDIPTLEIPLLDDSDSGGSVYTHTDFLRDEAEVDEILMKEIEQKQKARKKEIERMYRKAGRILNRNLYALGR